MAKGRAQRRMGPKVKPQCGHVTSENLPVCKRFNDQMGCSNRSCDHPHVCDYILTNGRLCGKKHSMLQHNVGNDGQILRQ